MYRESSKYANRERHFGFKELSSKTGIRSDATIRRALDGLLAKLAVEIISYHHGSPLGPKYRVYKPREIIRRRREAGMEIDPQSKRIITPVETPVEAPVDTPVATAGKTYGSTPAETTPVTPAKLTGDINRVNSFPNRKEEDDDDAALAGLNEALKRASKEVLGREPSPGEAERWKELGEVLAAELRIAAARTTVSSVPAFFAEHLRRRLWKIDKKEARAQGAELPDNAQALTPNVDAAKCPDCGGSGWWYPEGPEKGVKKCRHERLAEAPPAT